MISGPEPGKRASIRGIRPELALAHVEVLQVFYHAGLNCRITSATDGQHSVGSLHYLGAALDYGLAQVPRDQWEGIRDDIDAALGGGASKGGEFDVILEASKNHIHVEFQPKTPP